MVLEVVFQYRTLIGKCDLGVGLDWDEIEQMAAIESAFERRSCEDQDDGREREALAPTADDRRMKIGRRFRRETTELTAVLRGARINDRVEVVEIGPGGVVVRHAPFVAHGEHVEIVMEDGDNSYRFRAQGVWMRDDGDDYRVGLELIGMPVCLHNVAVSRREGDVVDRIAAAA
jgi:hypothetical protein